MSAVPCAGIWLRRLSVVWPWADFLTSLNAHELIYKNSSLRGSAGGSQERTAQVHRAPCVNVSRDESGREVERVFRSQAEVGLSLGVAAFPSLCSRPSQTSFGWFLTGL